MPFLIDQRQKEILRFLLTQELENFQKDEKFTRHDVIMLKGEERYDDFLKSLIKKLG